ncbi:hypothetical protein HPHPP25D_0996 [Helicobacter pylori Hp P-25d]|nr:hypothetical protein HPHPP25D_0996 [Helicobacter pylori Hp P-25d]
MEPSRNRLKNTAFFVGLFIVSFLIIMKRQTSPYAFTHNQTLVTQTPPISRNSLSLNQMTL